MGSDYYQDVNKELLDRDIRIYESMLRNTSYLEGMYVIVSTSEKYGTDMYLVDEVKFRNRKWSSNLSMAKGFSNRYEAEGIAIKFRYGNPRVELVTSDMVGKEIANIKRSYEGY